MRQRVKYPDTDLSYLDKQAPEIEPPWSETSFAYLGVKDTQHDTYDMSFEYLDDILRISLSDF